MPRRPLTFLLVATVVLAGCGRLADDAKGTRHESRGIAFELPSQWKVASDTAIGPGYLISLEDTRLLSAASILLTVNPAAQVSTLAEYTDTYMQNVAAALPANTSFKVTGKEVKPEVIDVRFTLRFGGVDLPGMANFSEHRLGNLTVFCVSQVTDDDRSGVQAAFDLVRRTLAASPGK